MRFPNLAFLFLVFLCLPVNPIYSQQDSLEEGNLLVVNSEPEGASVYIDSSLMGVTPLEIKNLSNGKYIAVVKLEGYKDKSYLIELVGNKVEKYAIMSGDYALLNIVSEPSGADFYLNDIKMGQTPIVNFKTPLGQQKINLKKDRYKDAAIYLSTVSYKYELSKKLEPNYGVFHLENAENLSFYMDGIQTDIIGDSFYVADGEHRLSFEGTQLRRPIENMVSVKSPLSYGLRINQNFFTFKYAFSSIFIPGLGQMLDGSVVKGFGIMLGVGLSAAYITTTGKNYDDKEQKYNNRKFIYENSNTEIEAIENYKEMEKLSEKANDYKKYYTVGWGIAAVIYAYNLFDVFYNHTHTSDFEVYPYNEEKSTGINFKWRIY